MSTKQQDVERKSARLEAKRARQAADDAPGPSSTADRWTIQQLVSQVLELRDQLKKAIARGAATAEANDELRSDVASLRQQVLRLERELGQSIGELAEQQKLFKERIESSRTAGPRHPVDGPKDTLSHRELQQRAKLAPCLVIRGLPWTLSQRDLRSAVLRLAPFRSCPGDSVVSVTHFGRSKLGEKGHWLAVMVEFRDVESKMAVKRLSHLLSAHNDQKHISFDHAVTAEQMRLRAAQWPQIQEAKAKGMKWAWSDVAPHKLLVFGGGAA
jgi:hypothetical protein